MKNFNKNTKLILAATLVFVFCSCANGVKEEETPDFHEIHLSWEGESLGSLFFEKYHLLLPFQITGLDNEFSLKLNMDFSGSFLSEEIFTDLANNNEDLLIRYDSINNSLFIQKLEGTLGQYSFKNKNIQLKKYFYTESDRVAGHIDLSFFNDKIIAVSFPMANIRVFDSYKKIPEFDSLEFTPFEISSGKIKIPVFINGKEYTFCLSSTSKIYALFNTENIDEEKELHTKINNKIIENPALFPMPGEKISDDQSDGIIGSVFFENKCLYIDLKSKKFAIKPI